MTDNEIIKALECCTRSCCSDNEIKDCSLKPFEDCSTRLAIDALDFIKRLQSQNDRDVKVKVEALYKVNDLKIENEHQKAEIERLQKLYKLAVAEREANVKGFAESLNSIKAEAIKEFAERLKESPRKISMMSFTKEGISTYIPVDNIDNLVKEMTEGTK